jgi:hypothetical protein
VSRKEKPYDDRSMSPLLAVAARRRIPLPVFRSMYPRSHALGLRPVSIGGNDHEGFDIDEVEKKLGAEQFASLLSGLIEVFCCGHRCWPADHPDPTRRNCEVHCVYARDLEAFLKSFGEQ